MSRRPPEIAIPLAEVNRHFPPEMVKEAAKGLEASGHGMADKSFVSGTPAEVAAFIQQYVDAGATWVSINDFMPLDLQPDEARQAGARAVEVARILKAGNGGEVPVAAHAATA